MQNAKNHSEQPHIGAFDHSFIHKSILQINEKKATKTSNNTREMQKLDRGVILT